MGPVRLYQVPNLQYGCSHHLFLAYEASHLVPLSPQALGIFAKYSTSG